MKKKLALNFLLVLANLIFLIGYQNANALDTSTYTQSSESLKQMTPETALTLLKEGNARFFAGKMKNRNLLKQAKLTHSNQHPFAFILSCMDSRGSPEIIFDQGIGDIFVGRVAGNVVDHDQLGSMEYATQIIGSHIIVVMGHTGCGAVKGACEGATLGNLTQLLNKITPAINTIKQNQHAALNCQDTKTINEIAKQNVLNMMQEITSKSPLIQQSIAQHKVMLIGAIQNLDTGRVTFIQ